MQLSAQRRPSKDCCSETHIFTDELANQKMNRGGWMMYVSSADAEDSPGRARREWYIPNSCLHILVLDDCNFLCCRPNASYKSI